jgi:glycosyltransferase involved in cell wall biosynthesis
MKLAIHILTYNEEEILPYALRNLLGLDVAIEIIVHDAMSTDRTRQIAAEYGARIVDWHTDGVNDGLAADLKNTCWRDTDADWVATLDADELLYFPYGAADTFKEYDRRGIAIIKPHGWDMTSDTYPTGKGQIYDEVKRGTRDRRFYSKPVLFSPRRIASIAFIPGAHDCTARLMNGTEIGPFIAAPPSHPPTYLLHFKHLGTIERLAKRLAVQRSRLSPANIEHHWGNFVEPLQHAIQCRKEIEENALDVPLNLPPINDYSVVILSAKIANVIRCMAAIRKHELPASIFVVSDGISKDDQAAVADVNWMDAPRPFCFARNANLGIQAAGKADVLLCNDDALLATPEGFDRMQEASLFFDIVSATVRGRCGCPQQKILRSGTWPEPKFFAFMCAYLTRRAIEIIGLFDERFLGGMCEDNDYCHRAIKARLRLGICGDAVVDHDRAYCTFARRADYTQTLAENRSRYRDKWGVRAEGDNGP